MRITSCVGTFTSTILLSMTILASQLYGQNYKAPVPASGGTNAAAANTTTTAKPHDDSFQIGPDDVLAINVWKEPEISRSVPVRSDGKVSLPLVGEVQAQAAPHLVQQIEVQAAPVDAAPRGHVLALEAQCDRGGDRRLRRQRPWTGAGRQQAARGQGEAEEARHGSTVGMAGWTCP